MKMIVLSKSIIFLSFMGILVFAGNQMTFVFNDDEPIRRIFVHKSGSFICVTEQANNLTLLVNGDEGKSQSFFLKHDSDDVVAVPKNFGKDYLKYYYDGKNATALSDVYEQQKKNTFSDKYQWSDPKKHSAFIEYFSAIVEKITVNSSPVDVRRFLDDIDKALGQMKYFKYLYKSQPEFDNDRFLDEYHQYQDLLIDLLKHDPKLMEKKFKKPMHIDFRQVFRRPFLPAGVFGMVVELAKNVETKANSPIDNPLLDVISLARTIAFFQQRCN